jgi:hypothetical protein
MGKPVAVETVLLGDMQHTVSIQTDDSRSVSGTGNQASSSPHNTTLLHVPRAVVKPCDPSVGLAAISSSIGFRIIEKITVAMDEREGARLSMTAGRVLQVRFRSSIAQVACVAGSLSEQLPWLFVTRTNYESFARNRPRSLTINVY